MKKKILGVYFLFFQQHEILEKKKKKIFVGAEPFLGYCPNDIVRKYFVLQESGLYCRDLGLNG